MSGERGERDDRELFGPYFDGQQEVYADPLAVYRMLVRGLDGEPNRYVRMLKSEHEAERFEAMERVIPVSREAFRMTAFDPSTGEGAQEADVLQTFTDFAIWLKKKEKTPRTTPTSQRPTESAHSASPILSDSA